jgi:hypothetical protein
VREIGSPAGNGTGGTSRLGPGGSIPASKSVAASVATSQDISGVALAHLNLAEITREFS